MNTKIIMEWNHNYKEILVAGSLYNSPGLLHFNNKIKAWVRRISILQQ